MPVGDHIEALQDAALAEWPGEQPRLHPHPLADLCRRGFRGEKRERFSALRFQKVRARLRRNIAAHRDLHIPAGPALIGADRPHRALDHSLVWLAQHRANYGPADAQANGNSPR